MITRNYKGVRITLVEKNNGKAVRSTVYAKKTQAAYCVQVSPATDFTIRVIYRSIKTGKNVGNNEASAQTKEGIIHWLNAFTEPNLIKYLCDY